MMKILVADDHSLFRDGIISLLEAAGFEVVGHVGDGAAAVEETLRLRPELVLMDISMPRMDGLEALKQIKEKLPQTQVVMLTVSDEDSDLLEAIKSGGDGYLLKSQNAEGFLASLRSLDRGEMSLTRQMSTRVIKNLVDASGEDQDKSEESKLTEREIELLQLAAQGLSNKAIARELSISENTVKYHIKKILQKLDAQNRTEAVSYAIREELIHQD